MCTNPWGAILSSGLVRINHNAINVHKAYFIHTIRNPSLTAIVVPVAVRCINVTKLPLEALQYLLNEVRLTF